MNSQINETHNSISISPMVLYYITNFLTSLGNPNACFDYISGFMNIDIDPITKGEILRTLKMINEDNWPSNNVNIMGFISTILLFLYRQTNSNKVDQIIAECIEDVEEYKSIGLFTEKKYLKMCCYLIKFANIHTSIQKIKMGNNVPIVAWDNQFLNIKFPIYYDDLYTETPIYYDDPQYWIIKGVEDVLV